MNRTFYQHILLFSILILSVTPCFSSPAIRIPVEVTQPDGSKLLVRLNGDEFGHFTTSVDGYLLKKDSNGFLGYCVQEKDGSIRQSGILAKNIEKRSRKDKAFLKTQPKGLLNKVEFRSRSLDRKKSLNALANEKAPSTLSTTKNRVQGVLDPIPSISSNSFPSTGSPKSLVILVDFQDVTFSPNNDSVEYSNMFNKPGYHQGNQNGSVRDYFSANSSGLFKPEFTVIGPVKVSKNAQYYGANDASDNDEYVADMIVEACNLIDPIVDFSEYDTDKDGTVDNVYVYYAGRGEADGGGTNTIWPHSFSLKSLNSSIKLDDTNIDPYACSNELSYLNIRAGIGTFTHEFGHVIGLPDMYDVDMDSYNGYGFDLNEWDLMAGGSYNNNSCTPPNLSIVERYILGWSTPLLLDSMQFVKLPDFGSTNVAYKIQTSNPGEFYLLENRQNDITIWDKYLPHHGMLIYHVDMRETDSTVIDYWGTNYKVSYIDCWRVNLVNAISSHQCCDLIEADDIQTFYTGFNFNYYSEGLKGDVFPGSTNAKRFSEISNPRMRTWKGDYLRMPLNNISERYDTIGFDFMNYSNFSTAPRVAGALYIKPYSFTAAWHSIENATAYHLDVYTMDANASMPVKHYIAGYQNKLVTDTFHTVRVPNDLTRYYYEVRASNFNILTSPTSDSASLFTPDGRPYIARPTLLDNFSFRANWLTPSYATGVYLDVFTLNPTNGDTIWAEGYRNVFTPYSSLSILNLEDQTTYYYRIRGTDGYSISKNSVQMAATTTRATQITALVKDGTIYLKGADKDSEVVVYNLSGKVILRTKSNRIGLSNPGTYVVTAFFNQTKKQFKLLVP